MKILNTLGPISTDSYRASEYWLKSIGVDAKIKLYSSFEELFSKLSLGQYIVMPIGYSNRIDDEMRSWVDYHFKYSNILDVEDVFILDTMRMVLVEYLDYLIDGVIIQSSTYQFTRGIKGLGKENYFYAPSKTKALQLFLDNKFRYTVCSESDYQNLCNNISNKYKILHEYSPQMIWIVYSVKHSDINKAI